MKSTKQPFLALLTLAALAAGTWAQAWSRHLEMARRLRRVPPGERDPPRPIHTIFNKLSPIINKRRARLWVLPK